jgi:hypothetical protein
MEEPFKHEPGSPEALAEGCTCPPQAGPGAAVGPDGRLGYVCDHNCPMHGIEVVKRALAEGGARLLNDDDAENDNEPTRH